MAISKEEVIGLHGPWTAHNIEYASGEFTISPGGNADWLRDRATFYAACAEYSLGRPFGSLRTLDLGCLEGGMSFHFAKFGAQALGLKFERAMLPSATSPLAHPAWRTCRSSKAIC